MNVGWRQAHCGYFAGGRSGPGSLTHAPVVPLKIWQMQAPLQGLVALHVPLQNGSKLDGVRSCRAETVPAQRTAVASAARNVFLIVLLMIHSSFQYQAEENEYGPAILPAWLCYFPEGATPAGRTVQNAVNGVVKEQKQPAAQGWVALQLPPQVNPLTPLRNCRAEIVPAQRTAKAIAESEKFCMVFLMIGLPFNYKAGCVPLLQHGCAGDGMRRTKRTARFHREYAEAACAARFVDAAAAATGGRAFGVAPQLPGRDGPGAENTNDQCDKEH